MRFCAFLLLAAACGNPDNLVIGGIGATATVPVAFIDNVRSAVSGIATLTDSRGNQIGQRTVIVLTNTGGLCDQLGSHPDYFQNPPQDYVALLLFTPLDKVGTFFPGRDQGTDGLVIAAARSSAPGKYPEVQTGANYISVSDLSSNGGNARGSFDLAFVDTASLAHEFYGRFKTGSCGALSSAVIALP